MTLLWGFFFLLSENIFKNDYSKTSPSGGAQSWRLRKRFLRKIQGVTILSGQPSENSDEKKRVHCAASEDASQKMFRGRKKTSKFHAKEKAR